MSGGDKEPRWLRRIAVVVVAILLILAASLVTGIPQKAAFELALGYVLDAEVEVSGLKTVPTVAAARVEIRDHDAAASMPPAIVIEELAVRYSLFSNQGRYLDSVQADNLRLQLHEAGKRISNFKFLTRPNVPEKDSDSAATFLPKTIAVRHVDASVSLPEGGFDLRGLGVEAAFPASGVARVSILGDHVEGRGWSAWSGAIQTGDEPGTVHFALERKENQLLLTEGVFDVPGIGSMTINGSGVVLHDALQLTADIEEAQLAAGAWSGILSRMSGLPLEWQMAQTESLHVEAAYGEGGFSVSEITGAANMRGMVLGPIPAPYYQGDAAMQAVFKDGKGGVSVSLHDGQRMDIAFTELPPTGPITASFSDWSVADVATLVPHAYADRAQYFAPLAPFSGEAVVTLTDSGYSVDAHISGMGAPSPVVLTAKGRGGIGDGAPYFDGQYEATLGEGQVAGNAILRKESPALALQADFSGVALKAVEPILPDGVLPKGASAVLDGEVSVEGDFDALRVNASLDTGGAAWDGMEALSGTPLSLDAQLEVRDLKEVAGHLAFEAGKWGSASIGDLRYVLPDSAAAGTVEAHIDFDHAPPELTGVPVYGLAHFSGPAQYKAGALHYDLTLEGEGLGYSDYQPSSSTETTLKADVVMDIPNRAFAVRRAELILEPGTTIVTHPFEGVIDPLQTKATFMMRSGLKPLQDLRYLGETSGLDFGAEGTLFVEGGTSVSTGLRLQAEAMALPDDLAALGGVTVRGKLAADLTGQRFRGQGRLNAGRIAMAGVVLNDVDFGWDAEGQDIVAKSFEAKLYGGTLRGAARIKVLGGLRAAINATVEDADLEVFSDKFKPPHTRLTGIADGKIGAVWSAADGVEKLEASIHSSEGFSVNRDLLEQLLLSKYTKGMFGAKTLDAIRENVLGEAGQRPFKSGGIDLRWADTEYVGTVSLESEALNLTVDLTVEEEVIAEALRLRQESRLEDLASISLEPVE